jgi:DNA-binding response OmpR family regulator
LDKKHKILVIDDNQLIRHALIMLLEEADYDVRTAAHLAEFNETLDTWKPDTVLADVQMPDMTGDQLCLSLKKRFDVRVILFSNLSPQQLEEICKECGADGYVSKLDGFAALPERLSAILSE